MGSSVGAVRNGQFIGGGADKTFVLGFKPRSVKIVNITDQITSEKLESMPDDKALTRAQNGDATYSDHIALTSDGFTVLAALAVAAKEIHYEAVQSLTER